MSAEKWVWCSHAFYVLEYLEESFNFGDGSYQYGASHGQGM